MAENWQQILSEFGPDVWRTVRCLVGNEADARDCYQIVFLDAFQFSKKQAIRDWQSILQRMARLRALDHLRKRYRQAAHVDNSTTSEEAISKLPSAESTVESTELGERLRASLAELTPEQAEVFVMRYVDQLSYDEIAERIGSNRNAIGAKLSRARKQLRILLGQTTTRESREAKR